MIYIIYSKNLCVGVHFYNRINKIYPKSFKSIITSVKKSIFNNLLNVLINKY